MTDSPPRNDDAAGSRGRVYRSRPRLFRRRRQELAGPPFLPARARDPRVPSAAAGPAAVGAAPPGSRRGAGGDGYGPAGAGAWTGAGGRPAGAVGRARDDREPLLPAGYPPRRRARVRWWWIVLPLVLVLVVYPLLLFVTAWTSLHRIDALPASGPAATPGRTYLVVGSDSRAALTAAERRRLHTGQAAGKRTDTIMLLHVPDSSGPTVLVSVPRDSYVAIPGHSKNKINAAYALGGPQLLVRAVQQATGLRIDSYVETGLGGYAQLVDAIGGIDVCVKRALKDAKAHIDVKAGCQTFDGATALGYARARYSDPRGDLGRVDRQRQVLAAMAGRTLSPSVLLVPWRALPAASSGGNALTVDSGMSPFGLLAFIQAMRAVAGGGGLSLTVPVATTGLQTPAGVAVQWNTTQANRLFAALRADNTEAVRPIAAEQQKATGA
jgi:LCP family protein required for cell wall assembly